MLWFISILNMHCLHFCLNLLQLGRQNLMGDLHRVCHMIDRFWNNRRILSWRLLLLQEFLQSCDHIVHHVYVVHTIFFYGEIICFA